MDYWRNPFYCRMPEPIGEIKVNGLEIPVIPIPKKLLSNGWSGQVEVYALGLFMLDPNGKMVPAKYMIDMAVGKGLIGREGILVEPTSGSMGTALALHAKEYDISLYAAVADTMSEGKLLPQIRYGAIIKKESELVHELGLEKSPGLMKLSGLYAEKIGGVFLDQYHNPWNPESWAQLAQPLHEMFGETLTEAFFGLGSTGTVRGLGGALKELYPQITIIGTHAYVGEKIAGLRDPDRLKEVAPWERFVDVIDPIDERAVRAYTAELFDVGAIPAGPSSAAVLGTCNHYFSNLKGNGRLYRARVAIMPFMDTIAPYS